MSTIQDVPGALEAIRQWEIAHYAALGEDVRFVLDRVARDNLSPVDRIIYTAEAIYADRDKVTAPAKALATDLLAFAATYGWHGLNGGRAAAIASVLAGDEEAAPDPLPQFVRAPAPPAPVE